MTGENSDRDLFGQPVQRRQRPRGRPAHRPSRETVNRVWLGLARGWKVKEVALSIGVSVPTLRQYYSSPLAHRQAAGLMLESLQLSRLNDQAEKGNVTAEKELMKALERGRRDQLAASYASDAPKPKRDRPVGKKAAAAEAAKGVRGRFAPPEPPRLIN